jgi:hypothetical protein
MLKKPSAWAPYKNGLGTVRGAQMGAMSAQETQMLGVAVLSAISIAGIHSAICPSYFTMKTFASQPEAKSRSMEGLWISLGVSAVTSASLYFVFKSWMPVIFAGATSLLLFGIGVAATNSEPPKTIPPIEKQQTTTEAPGIPQTGQSANV